MRSQPNYTEVVLLLVVDVVNIVVVVLFLYRFILGLVMVNLI